MSKVTVLVEGIAKQIDGGWIASSTATLIQTPTKKIIVDPGCDRKALLAALKKNQISLESIDYVLLTHSHTDHALLCGIFENAKVINPVEMYEGSTQTEYESTFLGNELEIIQTPGHCQEHCSLVVPTKEGIIVVAGDLFWWVEDEEQKVDVRKIDDAHPLETNMAQIIESRKKVLKIADFIIPGHGKMFKVEK